MPQIYYSMNGTCQTIASPVSVVCRFSSQSRINYFADALIMFIGVGRTSIILLRQHICTWKGVTIMTGKNEKVCAVTDAGALSRLTRDAEYSCSRCGAKAHDKASVCEPVEIEPDH